MIVITKNHIGRVHHAAQHQALATTRPIYCFIPEACFGTDGFDRGRYLTSLWPNINCGANPLAVGSHVIPDPSRPVSLKSRCPVLAEFLKGLELVASTRSNVAS